MSLYRKNTLVVDFSVLPKRILTDQVEEFLKDVVKLDMTDVRNIQLHSLDKCLYIEIQDAGVLTRLAKQHHLRHYLEYKGIRYYIPMYVDGPTTTVRIHDLPPQMSNTTISQHMQQYGKVISIHNEVWKNYFSGIPNGVRVVRMKIEKTVPSQITIDNQSSLVTYLKGDKFKTARHEEKQDGKKPSEEKTVSSAAVVDETSQANNDENHAPASHTDNDDDENDKQTDNDQGQEPTTKRRLSTKTSSDENEETRNSDPNSGKDLERNPSPDSGDDSEFRRVTRSRKFRKISK